MAPDLKWIRARKLVFERDNYKCQLEKVLIPVEMLLLRQQPLYLSIRRNDPAHIFNKAIYPELYYDIENIVTLNRFSHTAIDNMKNPITNEPLTDDYEQWDFWIRMVGQERFYNLLIKLNRQKEIEIYEQRN